MDLFKVHTRPPSNGSILDSYTITEVIGPPKQERGILRSLVLAANHRDDTTVPKRVWIIKIVFESEAIAQIDVLREFKIHYFLTQIDAEAVRAAAKQHKLLAVSLLSADQEEAEVRKAIVAGKTHNIVPMLDFWVGKFERRDLQLSGDPKDAEILSTIPRRAFDVGISVQARFKRTLTQHLAEAPLWSLIDDAATSLAQAGCQLHALMAIGYSHGDSHTDNYGVEEGVDRYYVLVKDDTAVRLPASASQVMMFDFGFSHLRTTDASGTRTWLAPSAGLQRARRLDTDGKYVFSPSFDLFRLCQSIAAVLAERIGKLPAVGDVQTVIGSTARANLLMALDKGINVSTSLRSSKAILSAFIEKLGGDNVADIRTAARTLVADTDNQDELWLEVARATKGQGIKDMMDSLLPYDLIKELGTTSVPAGDGWVDMTMRPVYGKGKVYNPPERINVKAGEERVHPLIVHKWEDIT